MNTAEKLESLRSDLRKAETAHLAACQAKLDSSGRETDDEIIALNCAIEDTGEDEDAAREALEAFESMIK